jgi:phage shock protein E
MQMKKTLVFILNSILLLSACTNLKEKSNSQTEVVQIPQQVEKFSDALFIDVRTEEEFEEGSVPNAINIPLSDVEKRITEFKTNKKIVVFCRSGNRSNQAKTILEKNGIANIIDGGGIDDVKKKLAE